MSKTADKPLGNKRKRKTPVSNEDLTALHARAILLSVTQNWEGKLEKLKEAEPKREFLRQEKTLNELVLVSQEFVQLIKRNSAYFKQMTSLSILASQKTSENEKLKKFINLEVDKIKLAYEKRIEELEKENEELKTNI